MMVPEQFAVCRAAALAALIGSAFWAVAGEPCAAAQRSDGQLTIEVVDSEGSQPIAARMHLKNARGRPVDLRLPGTADFGGHFYIDGSATLPLRVGQYTFELDAGPEYRTQSGHFEIERHADDSKRIEMKRFANLNNEGWYGGDLDIGRLFADLPLIARAEGLSIMPAQKVLAGRPPQKNSRRRSQPTLSVAKGERFSAPQSELIPALGGELLLIDTELPFDSVVDYRDISSTLEGIRTARQRDVRIIARTPYAWELPVWLAGGDLDAIQLIHHHAQYDGAVDNEDDGRPRDKKLFPGRRGNGRWSEVVYYHVLNCGFRIPPVAGSGSGWNHNPVGANRVYAYCGEGFSEEAWWDSVLNGRVVVTNGPLLRPKVEGRAPGYVFHLDSGGLLSFEIGLDLATRVPVEYLQIIKNGEVAADVRLADWTKQKGRLPPLAFDASGWFLVRAVTNNQRNYQFASSGPYYVEKAGQPRVSRRSVQFFLDWIDAATARLNAMGKFEPRLLNTLLAEQETARQHFERLLSEANSD
jgi:hypothetical protein